MSSEPLFPELAKQRTTSEKVVETAVILFRPIAGALGGLIAVVIAAVIISAAKAFLGLDIPDSAWIAALVLVVGHDIASSIRDAAGSERKQAKPLA